MHWRPPANAVVRECSDTAWKTPIASTAARIAREALAHTVSWITFERTKWAAPTAAWLTDYLKPPAPQAAPA